MSSGTTTKDREDSPYPQWGAEREIYVSQSDWSPTAAIADTESAAVDGMAAGGEVDTFGLSDHVTGDEVSWGPDTGATTAEYAITTLAACGFAALLVVILKSEPIKELVTGVIQSALGLGA